MSLIAHYLLHNGFEGLDQCNTLNTVRLNSDNSGLFPGVTNTGLKAQKVFDIDENFSWFLAVKLSDKNNEYQLIDMRNPDGTGYQPLHMYSTGDIQFYANIGNLSSAVTFPSGNYIKEGKWHYIALIKKSDNISCYVDGKFIAEYKLQYAIKLTNLPLFVGRRHSQISGTGTTYSLNGMISDVRLYDHALSEEEIKKLSSDLVCHYTFDTIRSSEHSSDSSKSNLDGIGGSAIFDTPGAVGAWGARLAKFSDTVGDYIEINSAVKLVPPFSYSIWAKPLEDPTDHAGKIKYFLLSNHGGDYDYTNGFSLYLTKSSLHLKRKTTTNISLPGINIFDWHLYTITVTSDNICTVYFDGEVKDTINLSSFSWNTSCPFTIGVQSTWTPASGAYIKQDFYDGFVDDFRAYRRALSQNEIKDLMHLRASVYNTGIVEVPYYNNLNSDLIRLADNNDIQLSKNGVLSNIDLIEQEYKIINGKKFLKIVEHDVRYIQEYFNPNHSEDLFSCGPNRFSMLGIIEDFWSVDTDELEFLLTYPDEAHTYLTEFSDNEYRELPFKIDWNSDWNISFSLADIKRTPFKIMLDNTTAVMLGIIESIPAYGIPGGYLLHCGDATCTDKSQSTSGVRDDIPLTSSTLRTIVLSFNSATGLLKLESNGKSSEWDVTKSPNGPTVLNRDSISGLYPFNPCSIYIGGNPQVRLEYSSTCHYNLWRQDWGVFDAMLPDPDHYNYTPLQIDYIAQWGSPDASGLPGLGLNDAREWSLLDCGPLHGYWYGGLIQYQPYTENGIIGFPAPDGRIHKWVQLWVRVDNTEFKEEPILANNVLFTKSLMED